MPRFSFGSSLGELGSVSPKFGTNFGDRVGNVVVGDDDVVVVVAVDDDDEAAASDGSVETNFERSPSLKNSSEVVASDAVAVVVVVVGLRRFRAVAVVVVVVSEVESRS